VLTRRRDDMRRHAGEVSFPGGRADPEDADLPSTALREAHEEIGLPPAAVQLIGALQPTPTIATNYAVYPFVGLIEPGFAWEPSAGEVAEVLELPLGALRAGHAPAQHASARPWCGAPRRGCWATCSSACRPP
jgi:8-oxo-dGTP pyrophosphatase MutT (NUDIX family)